MLHLPSVILTVVSAWSGARLEGRRTLCGTSPASGARSQDPGVETTGTELLTHSLHYAVCCLWSKIQLESSRDKQFIALNNSNRRISS